MLTRRDRLERIAAAERDRRAGRVELAVAALGEGAEWPARVVLALTRLPEAQGEETRVILMSALDAWAEESGLDPLSEIVEESIGAETSDSDEANLEDPIEHEELEAAFAVAETQVDEMIDVNEVAERVLLDEPTDLAELPEDSLDADASDVDGDVDVDEDRPIQDDLVQAVPEQTDAAWAAAPIWPEPTSTDAVEKFDLLADCAEGVDSEIQFASAPASVDPVGLAEEESADPARAVVLATLERWLANLQMHRNRSSRPLGSEGDAQ